MQGWRPDATFAIGNAVYSTHLDPQRVLFDAIGNRVAGGFSQAGVVEGWSAGAEMLLAKGYESYAFTLLASIAAPLLTFFEDCGLVISIQSLKPEGRDLMVQALTSPWGDRSCLTVRAPEPLEERLRSWRALGTLPSYYADLLRLDPYTRQKFIPEALQASKLLFCCNMEGAPEDDKVLTINHKTRRRIVLEVGADVEKKYQLDNQQVKVILTKNYGSAAPRFYQYAVRNFGAIKGMVKSLEERFYEDIKKGNHDMHPYSALLAVTATAAMVCAKTGILPITPERMTRWMLDRISENHTGRPAFAKDPEELLIQFLLEQNEHLAIISGEDEGFGRGNQRYFEPRPGKNVEVKLEYFRNRLHVATPFFGEWLRARGYVAKKIRQDLLDRGVAVRDLFHYNMHGRMNGKKAYWQTTLILDARTHSVQEAIQEWSKRLEIPLAPHDAFPPFLGLVDRQKRLKAQRNALSQPSETPALPHQEDAPES